MTRAGFRWPDGARAAVSLTYDDGLTCHLDAAIPQLRLYGFAGTFFVNPGVQHFGNRRADWKAVARSEQELGNHTFSHPCGRDRAFVRKGSALEDHDETRMTAEIERAIDELVNLGVARVRSFAYPCGQTFFDHDRRSYVPMVERRHVVARTVIRSLSDPATVDLMQVPAYNGLETAAPCLEGVHEAIDRGHWIVFSFHGVGADYMVLPLEEHAALLEGLSALRASLWVAPLGEVGAFIQTARVANR